MLRRRFNPTSTQHIANRLRLLTPAARSKKRPSLLDVAPEVKPALGTIGACNKLSYARSEALPLTHPPYSPPKPSSHPTIAAPLTKTEERRLHRLLHSTSQPSPAVDPALLELLRNHRVFLYLDDHSQSYPSWFLCQSLPFLKQCGVNVLYLEMVPSASQYLLDNLNTHPTQDNSNALNYGVLDTWDSYRYSAHRDYRQIIDTAHELGIKVIGIGGGKPLDLADNNRHWHSIISPGLPYTNKSVIFAGLYHAGALERACQHTPSTTKELGIDELLSPNAGKVPVLATDRIFRSPYLSHVKNLDKLPQLVDYTFTTLPLLQTTPQLSL